MKLEVNSQGFYRVLLDNGRYLKDEDLMRLISSNHNSSIMVYGTKAAALKGYAYYLELRNRDGISFRETYIADDWKKDDI